MRAGLRILEAISELNDADPGLGLQVRVGINTGEAVVAVGARPELGEGFVTGDVVNTASRLQGVAPVDGVAVAEQTYRQTELVFDYELLEPVVVKGKTEPLAIFRPIRRSSRLRQGCHSHAHDTADGQRSGEVAADRNLRTGDAAAVVPVGDARGRAGCWQEPLVRRASPSRRRNAGAGQMAAGSLPALRGRNRLLGAGEIVKAECGILESDTPAQAATKLERAVAEDERRPLVATCPPGAARRGTCGAGRPGGVVRGLAAVLREPRGRSGRPCSCSRICTGPTRRCSAFSSTWPTGPRAFRCCSSARRGPSCTSGIRPSEPTHAMRSGSTSPL